MKMNPNWKPMTLAIALAVAALGVGGYGSWKERHPNLVFDPPVPSADGDAPVIRLHPPTSQSSAPATSLDNGRDAQFALAQRAAAQREAARQVNEAANAREIQNYVDGYMAELLKHPELIQAPANQPKPVIAARSAQ